MSGGSFNYLCYSEFPEIMDRTVDMFEVEKELISRGYTDIAKDVRRMIEYCLTAQNAICVMKENLEDVFLAIEWRCSGDIGEKSLINALEKYRKGGVENG